MQGLYQGHFARCFTMFSMTNMLEQLLYYYQKKRRLEIQSPFCLSYLLLHIYPNPLGAQAFARNGQGNASPLHGRAQHHKSATLPYVVDGIYR